MTNKKNRGMKELEMRHSWNDNCFRFSAEKGAQKRGRAPFLVQSA